jgi:NAD(P)-dependent dehydrogenase (short-subunit alcohol dehydrogenase family)
VNVLSPGSTKTPALKNLTSNEAEWEAFETQLSGMTPLNRVADPREIGRVAVFLASEDSSYVNGVELFVDGGMAQI